MKASFMALSTDEGVAVDKGDTGQVLRERARSRPAVKASERFDASNGIRRGSRPVSTRTQGRLHLYVR
jgi:hypothetical protein